MKPFVIMVTYGRPDETRRTLNALEQTTSLDDEIEFVIVDNGSDNAMRVWLRDWWSAHKPHGELHLMEENIGCPRALNYALLHHRKLGQPVVKIDNDVESLTVGWVGLVERFIERFNSNSGADVPGAPYQLAMVGAFYDGVLGQDGQNGRLRHSEPFIFEYERLKVPGIVHHISPIIGHAVWHTGPFMDRIGYFDVLGPDHLYGLEDNLVSHKADQLRWWLTVWDGWNIKNIQRRNSLGGATAAREHVEKFREEYKRRVYAIGGGGSLYTGPDGRPEPTGRR